MVNPEHPLVAAAGTTAIFALSSKMLSDPLEPSISPELAKQRLLASNAFWAIGGLVVGCFVGCFACSRKGRS